MIDSLKEVSTYDEWRICIYESVIGMGFYVQVYKDKHLVYFSELSELPRIRTLMNARVMGYMVYYRFRKYGESREYNEILSTVEADIRQALTHHKRR